MLTSAKSLNRSVVATAVTLVTTIIMIDAAAKIAMVAEAEKTGPRSNLN